MFAQRGYGSFQFGTSLTDLGKKMLIMYAVVYVLELILEHWVGVPIYRLLALSPLGSNQFHLWQFFTHPFLHNPGAPINFLLQCLVFYFFAGTIENALGTRRFLILYVSAAVGGALIGFAFSGLPFLHAPFAGMSPSLLALIVTFGFMHPESTVLFMFILPIKAKFISYGTIIVTTLTFLATVNVFGAYHLGGILFGYLYFRGPTQWLDYNWWYWKFFQFKQKKRRSRFTVVKGKKGDKDKPTIH